MKTLRTSQVLGATLALALWASCSSEPGERSAPPMDSSADVEADAWPGSPTADAGQDATSDADPLDVADAPLVPDAPVTVLPLTAAEVVRVGEAGGIDISSSALSLGSETLVVFDSFAPDYAGSRLLETRSTTDIVFSTPVSMSFGAQVYQAGPSIVSVGGVQWLYLQLSNTLYNDAPTLARCAYDGAGFSSPEVLPVIPGVDSLLSWPKFLSLPDGSVAVAFRDGWSRPKFALSADGKTFAAPILVGPSTGGAMPAAGAFADGSIAFTYQTGSNAMTSWYRVSRDRGASWTAAEKVTTSSANVHDTTLVLREDGALDLYYIYPAGPVGFSTFRRALSVDGALGSEQRVTDDSVGDTSKPAVRRLECTSPRNSTQVVP
ncbi:MAG: sialidase family protein, partial [Myxococcota bacterium]